MQLRNRDMKNSIFKIAVLSLFIASNAYGQDIHFSAVDYSPMTINPSLVGAKYDLQATVNYRNQWSSVGAPFQTIAAGYDMRFGDLRRNKKGYLAAGINFNNDAAGKNKIESNNIGLSVAYHLKLNNENKIGLGIQGAWGQRSMSVVDGKWGNQYNGFAYDSELPSGEVFNNTSFSYVDMGAGLVYSYESKQQTTKNNNGTRVNIGLAAYHLNRPSVSFIKSNNDKLYIRTSAFAMAEIGLGNTRMAVEPQLFMQFQGPAMETIFGADYRFFLGKGESYSGHYKGTSLAVGLFIRNQDALISRFSLRLWEFDLGMVYDFNILSSLKRVSNSKGGVEVFLRYILNKSIIKNRSKI